jgi:hypothetical protein
MKVLIYDDPNMNNVYTDWNILSGKVITVDSRKESIYCEKDELLSQLYSVIQKHLMVFEMR